MLSSMTESRVMNKYAHDTFTRPLLATAAIMVLLATFPTEQTAAQEQGDVQEFQEDWAQVQGGVVELPPIYITVQGTSIAAKKAGHKKKGPPPPASSSNIEIENIGSSSGTPSGGANSSTTSSAAGSFHGGNGNGIPAAQVGSAVTVVTGAQLRASQVRHAGDALRSLPGVHVNRSGGVSNFTQVRMRGAEGNHTLVLVDGIEANSTSGGEFDFSNLLTNDIERIEVIRGGHSGIYGSKAIGGVINIITKSGKGPITLEASAEGGGFETRGIAARISGGTDQMWLSASMQHQASNSFNIAIVGEENDPWRNTAVSLKGGAQITDGVTLDFTLRNSKKFLNFDREARAPGSLLNVATDAPNTSDTNVFLGGANLKWELFDGALTQVLRATRNRTNLESSTTFGNTENLSESSKYGYLITYRFDTPLLVSARHTFSGLIEKQFEGFTPRFSFTDARKREREQVAAVAEYRGEFANRVFLSGNFRQDRNNTFEDFTTWHTGISIPTPEIGIRPHASAGTSVALPGMFEQFGSILGIFTGNPDLEPEKSFGWDAGVEFTLPFGNALLDVTYFKANLENEIRGFGNTTRNLEGESTRSGLEVALKSQLYPWLYLGASYTYLNANEPDGTQESRRPKHTGKAEVIALFDQGRGNVSLSAAYNGHMTDRNFGTFPATIVTLDEYVLMSLAASYKIKPQIELFGRVENLLNADYEEISGYNTPQIAAYAGLRIKLQDTSTAHWKKYE